MRRISPAHRYTLFDATAALIRFIRRRRSSAGISSAVWMAAAISSGANGLTMRASASSRAAPANALRIRTPSPSIRLATYSFATRFIPSWRGLTRQKSAIRCSAISAARSTCRRTKTTGFHGPRPHAGARGYLLKDSADEDVERAIRSVAIGRPFFSPSIAHALLEDYIRLMRERRVQDSYELLTEREREVLQLLAEGKSNKEAAAILDVSPYTIETHRQNLMQKLGLHNTAEIVLYAVRKAIITA